MNKYTVLVPADKLKTIIPIPPEFEHQQVEVAISLPRRKEFNPRKYRGAARGSRELVDGEINMIKRDWERDGR